MFLLDKRVLVSGKSTLVVVSIVLEARYFSGTLATLTLGLCPEHFSGFELTLRFFHAVFFSGKIA